MYTLCPYATLCRTFDHEALHTGSDAGESIGRQMAVRAGSLGIFRIHEDGIALDAEVDEISDRAVRKKLAGKDFRRFTRNILRLRDSDGQVVAACDFKESLALRADSIICGVQNIEFDFIATVDQCLAPFLEA